jgi:hypothetical protein
MAAATVTPSIPLLLTPVLQLRQGLLSLGYAAQIFTSCFRTFVFSKNCLDSFGSWHSLFQEFRDCG